MMVSKNILHYAWLLVVYIPCHFFSGQLLFTLRAPKNQLRKNLVRLTRAMVILAYDFQLNKLTSLFEKKTQMKN